MKIFALAVLAAMVFNNNSNAMEGRPKSELKVTSEMSFEIIDYYRGRLYG